MSEATSKSNKKNGTKNNNNTPKTKTKTKLKQSSLAESVKYSVIKPKGRSTKRPNSSMLENPAKSQDSRTSPSSLGGASRYPQYDPSSYSDSCNPDDFLSKPEPDKKKKGGRKKNK